MEKKSLKIISITLAILLLLSIITIAILSTLLIVEKNNVIDFTIPNTEIKKDETYALSDVNFMSVSDTEASVQSVNVTCKVKPFNATNKNLNWSLNWQNASSEWATGKTPTDYIQVIVDNIDTRNANITMLKAFGEIIILTVSSVSNPEVSKSVELRCIAELDFVTNFTFREIGYSFNKDGFVDGTTELSLNGRYYDYPHDNIEDFNINTQIYGSTSTNIKEKPFITFKYYKHSDFKILYQEIIYTVEYDYLNNLNVKVPIGEENQDLYMLPTSYTNPEGVNVGDDGDVSRLEHQAISLDYLLFNIIRNVTKTYNSYSYEYLEMKFMGTGPIIRINFDCK